MRYLVGLLLLLPLSALADVTFYGQCNYKGPSVTLKAGEFTANDLAKRGIPEDAIASVKVPDGFSVVLYENDGFKGRHGTLESSDACLDNNGFSNLVSSLTVKAPEVTFGSKSPTTFGNSSLQPNKPIAASGTVTVYTDCNYNGLSAKLSIGDYNLAQLKKFGLGNNEISSVKVPKGMNITVYENDFLRGDSASSGADVGCIDSGNFANRITSVSVSGGGAAVPAKPVATANRGVMIYDECNYNGNSALLRVGEYNNAQLNELGIDNNSISALQVPTGYQVELFLNDFQRGGSGILNTNNPCLVGQYDKAISSLIVRKKDASAAASATPAATLYVHCNYRGGSVQLPVGRYNKQALSAKVIKENTVSSIKLLPGYKATLYSGPDFNTKSVVITGDDDCLDNDNFNEQLSSIVIESSDTSAADGTGSFVAQPNQSNSTKADDLMAGLNCVQQFVESKACDARRWKAMESRCQLNRVEELSDGYLQGHVEAGNCNAELWDELVRRTANPHLR